MLDFSSALYLGLRHGSPELPVWMQLSTGRPAALAAPPGAEALAQRIARLQGCESGTLLPSTLHLFWDLFAIVAREPVAVFLDAGTYPIVRWGLERVKGRGVPLRIFPHHDPEALHHLLRCAGSRRPVVVVDGLCPACGVAAPLAAYLEAIEYIGGLLVIDDTQALGILGEPSRVAPYGRGGGGSLRWSRAVGPDVLVGSSLAKGFGAPLAVLSGSTGWVRRFEERSETRVHCSPPSVAVIHAAERAVAINRERGDALRLRLARLVERFRGGLADIGMQASGGSFPVQTLATTRGKRAVALYHELQGMGIRAVLHRGRAGSMARVSFLITARHTLADVDRLVDALANANELVDQGGRSCETVLSRAIGVSRVASDPG